MQSLFMKPKNAQCHPLPPPPLLKWSGPWSFYHWESSLVSNGLRGLIPADTQSPPSQYPEYPPNLSGKKGEVPNDFHIPRGYLHIPLQTLPAAAVCKPGTERLEQGPVERWNGGSSCLLSCWLVVGGCTTPRERGRFKRNITRDRGRKRKVVT